MEISIKLVIDLAPSTVESINKIAQAFGRPQASDLAKLVELMGQAKAMEARAEELRPRTNVGPDVFKGEPNQETPPPGESLTGIDITPGAGQVKRSHKKKPDVAAAVTTVEPVKADVQPTNGKTPVITLATIQALSKEKAQAGNAKAIKGFLAELGIEKVSELAVADLEDFHAKLAAL